MTERILSPGANLPVEAAAVRVELSWSAAPGGPGAAVWAVLLTADGRVRGDGDLVHRGRPRHASGAVAHRGREGDGTGAVTGRVEVDRVEVDSVEVDLAAVEAEVTRIVLAASGEGGALGQVRGLSLRLVDAGTRAGPVRFDLAAGAESVLIGGELYRRERRWRFRALGQGYAAGAAGPAADFGISPEAVAAAVAPAPAPAPAPARTPPPVPPAPPVLPAPPGPGRGEERLPADVRERLSLRKRQVAVSLGKHGAAGIVARVVLVLDASGSMAALYSRGVVAGVVERVAAVAAQLEDDGAVQAWTFATNPARLPDLRVGELPEWLRLHVRVGQLERLFGRRRQRRPGPADGPVDMREVGVGNEEQKVIAEVRAFVRGNPVAVPTLVLFFSDGGVHRDAEIERELRAAADEPLFWQFVGLGRSGFGVLQRFDELPGRRVDNVGFFPVDDIAALPDPELYDRLLSQFPRWITAARRAGILRQGRVGPGR
ncbi:VWA domain-containing protein [Kitasatospora sp. NPDC056327]|uniref:vWA domain-containing protein n=1 Tax=Kitasatospora sp. NPDC056327 TaxID=3345785 RepID=UPI0035D6002E